MGLYCKMRHGLEPRSLIHVVVRGLLPSICRRKYKTAAKSCNNSLMTNECSEVQRLARVAPTPATVLPRLPVAYDVLNLEIDYNEPWGTLDGALCGE